MRRVGDAHVYGDDVDTDRIIAGKYTKTLDRSVLAAHVLEDLDPTFRQRLVEGDILFGGHNFGCGSSREQAAIALSSAGVGAVVAKSFARIFFRNAINIGLPVVVAPDLEAETGDTLEVDLGTGEVRNLTRRTTHAVSALPPVMRAILRAGGLVPYMRRTGGYPELPSEDSA